MRVLLVGDGPSAATLRQAYEAMGAEVRMCSLGEGVVSTAPAAIIVDELLDGVEQVAIDGASPHLSAAGLLAAFTEPVISPKLRSAAAPIYGSPRPYLKRKKGRS